ncbi:MAG: MFS transporter [Alphaproteobacteria bacterium]
MTVRPSAGAAVRLVATLCATYVISQFYRSSVAVIAPDLMREVRLSAEAMGMLTGAFFLAFALAQIPIGVLLDRYGPRRTIPALLVLAVAGALLFAAAAGLIGLTFARALMGLGCAGVLMGSLVVCSRWFPVDRFATLAAVLIGVGSAGNLLATSPLAGAAEALGWRAAFVAMGAITAGLGLLYFVVVRDAPPGHPFHRKTPETLGESLRGLREVLATPGLSHVFAISFVVYGTLASVLALWGGPYLHDVHGLDGIGRGNVLLAMALALIAGTACFGPLDRLLDTRKRIVLAGAFASAAVFALLALVPRPPLWQVTVLFVLLGFLSPYGVVVMAHSRALFPERLVGRGITTVNMAVFIGVAVLQLATGLIVGAFPTTDGAAPEAAYRLVFAFLGAVLLIAALYYRRVKDMKPSRDVGAEADLAPGKPGTLEPASGGRDSRGS